MAKDTKKNHKKPGRNGNQLPPGGRPKGIPNKTTTKFKEALNELLETAAPDMVEWLAEIPDPKERFEVLSKFAEYIYPKLARKTIVGDEEAPVVYKNLKDILSEIDGETSGLPNKT